MSDKPLVDFAASILHENFQLEIRLKGLSMYPTLLENDLGIVEKTNAATLNVGDIVAFKGSNQLVAHRVIKVNTAEGTLITKGDKNKFDDSPVAFEQIIGKLIAVKRNGKTMSMHNLRFRMYRILTLHTSWLCFPLFDSRLKLDRTLKKLSCEWKTLRSHIHFVVAQSRKLFLAHILIQALLALIPLGIIVCFKILVDFLATNESPINVGAFYGLLAATATLFLANGLLTELSSLSGEKMAQSIHRHIYKKLHDTHLQLQLSAYEQAGPQDRIHRIAQESSYRPVKFMQDLMSLIRAGVSAICLLGIFMSVKWYLIFILMGAAIPGILVRLRTTQSHHRMKEMQSGKERVMYYFNRILTAFPFAKELRLFGFAHYFESRFQALQNQLFDEKLQLTRKEMKWGMLSQLFAVVLIFGSIALITQLSLTGSISIGTVVLFFFAFQRGYSVLNDLFRSITLILEDHIYLKDITEFMTETQSSHQVSAGEKPFSLTQHIQFENVTFNYAQSQRSALKSVNVTIPAGKTVALVGENGSGKTTFIKLLCGFYTPTEGTILFDNTPATQIDNTLRRENISAVFQDFALYHLSALENIALGDCSRPADYEKARIAAQKAGIDSLLTAMPQGYHTNLGTLTRASEELSIGQWQKLAIARAFYRDAALILLDEPSSALDPKSESQIIEGMKKLSEGKTTILVSHRLSSVNWVDYILYFEKGEIVEQGSHEQLMALEGKYATLFGSELN